MAQKPRTRPTDAELAILTVLWNRGPSTVRGVHEILRPRADTGYTTVLKTMQIMADKGLLLRDESSRAHIYSPASSREETEGALVDDLAARAFEGSAAKLALRALESRKSTPEELAEIRRLLDEAGGEG